MRNALLPAHRPPLGARWEQGVTFVSAAIAFGLLLLTAALTVERLIDTVPPAVLAGLLRSAAAAGLVP